MNLAPMSDWRHGSTAPVRELTRDEKRERLEKLRASRVHWMLAREIHAGARVSDAFYRSVMGGEEPLPRMANMRGYDIPRLLWDYDRGSSLAAENVRVHDETEAART